MNDPIFKSSNARALPGEGGGGKLKAHKSLRQDNYKSKHPVFDITKYKEDSNIAFYTGFPNWDIFMLCYNMVKDSASGIIYGRYKKTRRSIKAYTGLPVVHVTQKQKALSRPFSNSQGWTGSSMEWRLMRVNLLKCKLICPHYPPFHARSSPTVRIRN